MNPDTGEIREVNREELEQWESEEGRRMIPLNKKQVNTLEGMPPNRRKNSMRNQPCPCGSGKKFKKCCWSIYK